MAAAQPGEEYLNKLLFVLIAAAWLLLSCSGNGPLLERSPTVPASTPSGNGVPPGASSPEPAPDAPLPEVRLERVFPALSFRQMTGMYQAPRDGSRFFVLEQAGRIMVFENRQDVSGASVFLDIRDRVTLSSEEGLLGLAFAPDFASSGVFYVYYSAASPRRSVLSRFLAPAPRTAADPNSETVILTVPQPFANHNGGQIGFGPDGYLYVGLGDGGSARDPEGNGQNLGTLLGSLLRIDVSASNQGQAYRVPPDNPFVGRPGARPEIYAYGLRNPWRFSWDAATGDLWLADVGQNAREEINVITRGGNYGWNIMEGSECLGGGSCDQAGLILPVFDYARAGGNCSVTGGYVYGGRAIPELRGAYVFGDYCSGRIWAIRYDGRAVTQHSLIVDAPFFLSSFAVDSQGEMYALAYDSGGIYRLVAR